MKRGVMAPATWRKRFRWADDANDVACVVGLVRDYVESTEGKLSLHYLPGYAAELNSDELAWSHVKRTGTVRRPLQ